MINVNWILSGSFRPEQAWDTESVRLIGPTWGSWKTWRHLETDNVICHDPAKINELLHRDLQHSCNFYIPEKYYQSAGRPLQVHLYQGDFTHDIDDLEDIIAMHLVSVRSEIILLAGIDLSEKPKTQDRYTDHKIHHRYNLIYNIIASTASVQWVVVDHARDVDKRFQILPNLTCDTMANVLKLLTQ